MEGVSEKDQLHPDLIIDTIHQCKELIHESANIDRVREFMRQAILELQWHKITRDLLSNWNFGQDRLATFIKVLRMARDVIGEEAKELIIFAEQHIEDAKEYYRMMRERVMEPKPIRIILSNVRLQMKKDLLKKIEVFRKQSRTQKQLFLSMITTFGLKQTMYSEEIVTNQVTLADLFKEV